MKKSKELHPVWLEWKSMPDSFRNHFSFKKPLIGKWHYHYENKNGRIGLIKIQVPRFGFLRKKTLYDMDFPYVWEACGILEFQRFSTKAAAETAIYKALKEKLDF